MKTLRLLLPILLAVTLIAPAACGRRPDEGAPSLAGAPSPTPTGPGAPLPADETAAPATPTNGAMRFELPTAMEPVSAWRPPLYPAPWAPSPYDHFYFERPIAADEVNWPLPNYRYGGVFFSSGQVHTGVDISADYGTPVLAAGPGTVVSAGWGLFENNPNSPYGRAVVLRHDFGYRDQPLFTVYAHLSEIDVIPGQWLATGEVLGNVGDTGHTTGPHLHFEVRLGSDQFFSTYNPELWLVPPQGWGLLVGRVMDTNRNLLASYQVYVIARQTGQTWEVRTYGSEAVNADPYYRENMVISDLPAGIYTVRIVYYGTLKETDIEILPGRVAYFSFQGYLGFDPSMPPTPDPLESLSPVP